MSKRIATRKPTGAELREQRDRRLGVTGPAAEATRRAQFIRDGLNSFADAIDEMALAWGREDWKVLGYKSWQEYCEGEFSGARIRLTIEQRRQATAALTAAGLTKRAAAAALGVSHTTVQKDTGSGNKLPLAGGEPQVKTDAEVADEVAQATASFDEKYSKDSGSAGDHTQTASEPPAGNGLASPEPVPGNPLDPPSRDHEVDESQALPSSSPGSGPSTPADPSLDQVALVADQPGLDSPFARGETGPLAPVAAEEPTSPGDSSAARNLTEEQAPTPLVEPVLSPSGAVGVADGGAAEEESTGEAGFSSADPDSVKDWFETVADMAEEIDLDVLGPLLSGSDMRRIEYEHERVSVVVRLLRERLNP